jgi:hypothetical protein
MCSNHRRVTSVGRLKADIGGCPLRVVTCLSSVQLVLYTYWGEPLARETAQIARLGPADLQQGSVIQFGY